MGIRHHADCLGKDCALLPELKPGDLLELKEEPENEYDSMAIRVLTQKGKHLGYIPHYYNKPILCRLGGLHKVWDGLNRLHKIFCRAGFDNTNPLVPGNDLVHNLQKFLPLRFLLAEAVFHVGKGFLLHCYAPPLI